MVKSKSNPLIISNEKLIRFDKAAIDSLKIGDDEFSFFDIFIRYLLFIIVTSIIVPTNPLINTICKELKVGIYLHERWMILWYKY